MVSKFVDVEFVTTDAIARRGKSLRDVPFEIAKKYESMGIAKIIINQEPTNLVVLERDVYRERDRNEHMPEEKYVNNILFVTNEPKFGSILSVGTSLGFRTSYFFSNSTDFYKFYTSNLIFLSSNLVFSEKTASVIRAAIFQRRIPFVYIVENFFGASDFETVCFMRSKLNVVFDKTTYKKIGLKMGELVKDRLVQMPKDHYVFWGLIEGIL